MATGGVGRGGAADIDDLAGAMLALLPEDGTPVLNRVMRVMLSRALADAVDQDRYFAARDRLLAEGRIGVQRGQGGQIFLRRPAAPPAAAPVRSEAALMGALARYLEGPFRKGLDLPAGAACIVEDTATQGPRRGRWARPDFILVSAMRFALMPGAQVDVHSFELKTETGATDLAVYEALAQTRFTHFGHLVWHLPEKSRAEARLAEIAQQCEQHGVGLIRMRDPDDVEACEILLDPQRKSTPPAIVEGFLQTRLKSAQIADIARVVNGTRR